ncbi:MAG: XRE family transcriptional regulator [Amaricoccus sp.]|mgnify:CR=1 FL=1|uniref:XRE family transcriptional regulator n=1 Tax=Amaricoccus sp. TaxID=1872485 RepID=UPI00331526AC
MLPKEGKELHATSRQSNDLTDLGRLIAEALRGELGDTHRTIKTVMRWTGASERTVKHWVSGTHLPSGIHLVLLARHSDAVMTQFLVAANRDTLLVGMELSAVKAKVLKVLHLIDGIDGD